MQNYVLESERLLVRPFMLSDSAFILKLLNSPSWIEMIGDRGIRNIKAAQQYIKKNMIDAYQANGFGFFLVALKENNTPIGLCGITQRKGYTCPDLGFAVLADYAGKGYMHEASLRILEHAKKDLCLHKITAFTAIENLSSQKLLEKLAFQFQGESFEPYFQSWVKKYQLEL